MDLTLSKGGGGAELVNVARIEALVLYVFRPAVGAAVVGGPAVRRPTSHEVDS
jgi:hypothetical protein